MCTKLYEFNKLMIGFGYFGSQSFIRLVIINSSNTQKEIKEFFEIIEDFTKKNHDSIRTITSK